MKLTVETITINNLVFGKETKLLDHGVLSICKDDVVAFAKEEDKIESLNVDITYPGERARIINVVDVVQPRCKVSGSLDWPGVLGDEITMAGSGITRAVEGMGIVLCQNNTYWSRKWGSFDMSGPCAPYTPYAQMPELIIEPIAPQMDFREYREAVRRIGFKTSVMLAKATLDKAADNSEVFDNSTKYPELPSIVYVYQIYSKQYDTENYREPMLYGIAVPDTLPLVIQPTEVLDGAISPCGGFRCITTYEIQNHSIITELFRRHGKDLNFAGVILTVTSVEAKHRDFVSKYAANLLKGNFNADGVIITKGVGGASTLCVGAIASEAEKLGIKAVPIIQILNSQSNTQTECLISEQNVTSIVQSGTYYHNYVLPPVEKLFGGPPDALFLSGDDGVIGGHKLATGMPAMGEVVSSCMKQVGMMSQVGNTFARGMDY